MGSRKQTVLDGVTYPSRAALKLAVQTYLKSMPLNVPIPDGLPYAILERHPQRQEKIGVGLKHIEVRMSAYGNNRCFHVIRTDGSVIDFSWQVPLGFTKDQPSLDAAARDAVYLQVFDVAKQDTSKQVHHVTPFKQLLNDWLATLGGRMPEVLHGGYRDDFAHEADKASWQDYHQKHAKLVLVTVEEHKFIHGSKNQF